MKGFTSERTVMIACRWSVTMMVQGRRASTVYTDGRRG
jgi:hypothetical protein